jgi:hypothetical protein
MVRHSVFVLPDAVIGPDAAGVIFQSGERGHEEHGQAGTLDGWRAEIAARAVGNPLFLLALSAAFAGPLLKRTNTEGGGLHFVGDSSTGKTTILEAACSCGAGRATGGAGGQPRTAWKARRRCSMTACWRWMKSANATRARWAQSSIAWATDAASSGQAEPARRDP